ncbi:CysZ protein [Azospirillaceae bacterium]
MWLRVGEDKGVRRRRVIRSLFLAFFQLFDPAIRRVAILSALGAMVAATVVAFAIGVVLRTVSIFSIPWLNVLTDLSVEFGVVAILILMFPTIVTAIASLFLEDVAAAVERRYYPDLPPPQSQTLREALIGAVQFAAIGIALNVAALPLYFFPPAAPFVYFTLNGYLLGREYFELVAFRRWSIEQAHRERRARSGRMFSAGLVIAVMMSVPFFNLLAPIVACAFMVHVIYGPPRLWRSSSHRS